MRCCTCDDNPASTLLACGHGTCDECLFALQMAEHRCLLCGASFGDAQLVSLLPSAAEEPLSTTSRAELLAHLNVAESAAEARLNNIRTRRTSMHKTSTHVRAHLDDIDGRIAQLQRERASLVARIDTLIDSRTKLLDDAEIVADVIRLQVRAARESVDTLSAQMAKQLMVTADLPMLPLAGFEILPPECDCRDLTWTLEPTCVDPTRAMLQLLDINEKRYIVAKPLDDNGQPVSPKCIKKLHAPPELCTAVQFRFLKTEAALRIPLDMQAPALAIDIEMRDGRRFTQTVCVPSYYETHVRDVLFADLSPDATFHTMSVCERFFAAVVGMTICVWNVESDTAVLLNQTTTVSPPTGLAFRSGSPAGVDWADVVTVVPRHGVVSIPVLNTPPPGKELSFCHSTAFCVWRDEVLYVTQSESCLRFRYGNDTYDFEKVTRVTSDGHCLFAHSTSPPNRVMCTYLYGRSHNYDAGRCRCKLIKPADMAVACAVLGKNTVYRALDGKVFCDERVIAVPYPAAMATSGRKLSLLYASSAPGVAMRMSLYDVKC